MWIRRWGRWQRIALATALSAGLSSASETTAATAAAASSGTISTYGGGVRPIGPATTVGQEPYRLAVIGSRLFVADTNNFVVRAVDLATGIETVVGGTGISGYSGDGGPAAHAQLTSPVGLAADANGNLYIADSSSFITNSNRIRKVDPTGTITTIAGTGQYGYGGDGGPATSAEFAAPQGLALDSSGDLYVADTQNFRVRKIDPAGIITTIAGDGKYGYSADGGSATTVSLRGPAAVGVDPGGNVYLVDGCRVRKVDISGTITTVAGIDTMCGYSGDGGPATAAELNLPEGVSVDSAGNIYIADSSNNRVRRINAAGVIMTAAGNGVRGYGGDGGPATMAQIFDPWDVAFDASGSLYIGDRAFLDPAPGLAARVRKVDPTGIITTTAGNGFVRYGGDGGPATQAQIGIGAYQPTCGEACGDPGITSQLATDSKKDLFIADPGNARVRRIDRYGTITTFAGNGVYAYGGDGGPATQAGLVRPEGVATDTGGDLYIADANGNRIRKVDTSGIITTVAGNGQGGYSGDGGPATAAGLSSPEGVAADLAGNIYVADTGNDAVRKIDTNGIITTLAGGPNETVNTAFGSPNPFYPCPPQDNTPAALSCLFFPQAVAVDASSNVYIADTFDNRVRKVNALGTISTVAGTSETGPGGFSGDGGPATAAQLSAPSGLVVDPAGNLYISDMRNNRVREVNASGIIQTVAGNGTPNFSGDGGPATQASLDYPAGLAISSGRLFIADTYYGRIRELS